MDIRERFQKEYFYKISGFLSGLSFIRGSTESRSAVILNFELISSPLSSQHHPTQAAQTLN